MADEPKGPFSDTTSRRIDNDPPSEPSSFPKELAEDEVDKPWEVPDLAERMRTYLDEKSTEDDAWKCPICGENSWGSGPAVGEIRSFSGGYALAGGPKYPVVVFTCHICGYMRLFNAMVAGVIELPTQEDDPPSAGEMAT